MQFIELLPDLDVRQRLTQLQGWYDEWEATDHWLSQRLAGLDLGKRHEMLRATHITNLQRRSRLKLIQDPFEVSSELVRQWGYDRLRQHLVMQFAGLTPAQRRLWLHNFLFIMTPDLRRLDHKIAKVRKYRTLGQQRNFLLGGPSGMGKTTYLDWLTLKFPAQVETESNHIPIIKIDAPVSNHSPKPLFQRMILECGMVYTAGDNEEDLLMKIGVYFQRCQVELLVVDEIEHVTRPQLRRRLLEVSNLTRGIPIVCASCHPQRWVEGDEEVAGRWNDYFELRPYTGQRLQQLLAFVELLLPFTEPSWLALESITTDDHPLPGLAKLIEGWTQGILRDIMILVMDASLRAIDEGLPCLSPTLLEDTWRNIQTQQLHRWHITTDTVR